MIHNLYIISEGGIAIYCKNFAKSTLDEQLISGFLLAIGNFAKEAVGSGLKKIEMQTGEQLCVYYDDSLKLTAAALVDSADYPKLVSAMLKKILGQYAEFFKGKIQSPNIVEEGPKFNPVVESLLKGKTGKRDKKRFILGLILGGLVLGLIYFLFSGYLRLSIVTFIDRILASGPHGYFDPILIFGGFSLKLESVLIACFVPSSFLAGYLAGSRTKGKRIGIFLFLFALCLNIILTIVRTSDFQNLLFIFMLIVYIPLVLLTSISLGYLGGLLKDRRVLYPLPPTVEQLKSKM